MNLSLKNLGKSQEINNKIEQKKRPFPNQEKTNWDNWDKKEVDKVFPNGRIPAKNKVKTGGREFWLDNGLTFIKVNPGDERDEIIKIASKLKPGGRNLSYLKPGNKMYTINIPKNKMPYGYWIPLPLEEKSRILTNEQFLNYADQAIDDFLNPKNSRDLAYSKEISSMVEEIGKKELMIMALAVAKQESGGAPLGQFVFHRWENGQSAFSQSIFHVLMKGPGTNARKKLGMTPGQMNHPKNSVKLFLAFLVEKKLDSLPSSSPENTAKYWKKRFDDLNEFATSYNGANWKKQNPNYVKNLKKYIKEAENTFKNPKSKEDYKKTRKETIKINNEVTREKIQKYVKKELSNNWYQPWSKKSTTNLSNNKINEITDKIINYMNKFNENFDPNYDIEITDDENKIYIRIIREDKTIVGNGPTTISKN